MILCPEKIIVGDGTTVLREQAVRILADGTIGEIENARTLSRKYPDEPVKRYEHATLLPGLCDMHAHLGYFPPMMAEDENDMFLAYHVLHKLQNALRQGITSVRDVASPEMMGKALRQAEERDYFVMPHVEAVGSGMCITGGHFHFADPGVIEVDGTDCLVKEIRRHFKDGYRWIKLMNSDSSEVAEYTLEEMQAAVNEIHRLGGKITVHATNVGGIQMCIDAGVDQIEHSCEMTMEQAQAMLDKKIAWTPTIYVYRQSLKAEQQKSCPDPAKLRRFGKAVQAANEHFLDFYYLGIFTVAGTDREELPIAQELSCMVELGLSPLQAIQAATLNSAKLLGRDHLTGSVTPGKEADILIVSGDAEQDISALKHPFAVFRKGQEVAGTADCK